MLIGDIKLISSPVVIVMNGEESIYENGTAACESVKTDNRLEVKSLSVKDDKIVVQLAEWETNAPFNFIGEAAVTY